MEHRPLEITVLSANDLKNVNLFSTMSVYVIATLAGDARTTQKTEAAKGGGRNPAWNFPMQFTVPYTTPPRSSRNPHLMLTFKLRSKRTLRDRDVGEVHVPVKDLRDNAAGDPKSVNFVSYQVRRPSGLPKGVLNFSYRFGDRVAGEAVPPMAVNEPVVAYPPAANTVYPPLIGSDRPGGYPTLVDGFGYPSTGPGYGHPGQNGYDYGMYQGYGHPNVHQGGRIGLGAGLIGGALGGILMGDIISDAANVGFEDGTDFDF